MPHLDQILREEDLRRSRATVRIDLTPYLQLIDTIRTQGGVGAVLSLQEGEQQRTQKRRLSLAAKERGYRLIWRIAPPGQLRFVLARPGEPAPGGRQRRTAATPPAERSAPHVEGGDSAAVATTMRASRRRRR
ncbi:MAG: hypothetical protein C4290_09770 [Chloroflexota bacterium]